MISLFQEAAEFRKETDRRLAEQSAEYWREAAELKKEAAKQSEEFKKEAAKQSAEYRREAMEFKKEAARQSAEYRKEAAEFKREAAELKKEAAERDKKADERLKKLEETLGGIGNSNGYYAEEFFQNSFSESLEFAGIKFDHIMKNAGFKGKENCEFDIVLVNGNTIAIIEAKYRVSSKFVKELVTKKLEQFRRLFPVYQNHVVYLGIAGMSFDKSVIENAKKHGVAVIRQEGKHVVVDSLPTKVY
ncbi:MAG: hypothetical protein LBU70_11175 [Chitinispirillales bacterium]|nr:hypothetical protein [Chitinispirillales bacterium]